MKLAFLVDSEIDAGTAKVIHALQMCDAYARYIDTVVLFISFNYMSEPDVMKYITGEIGRKPSFQIKHFPLPSIKGRFKMLSGLLGLHTIWRQIEEMDCCVTLSPLMMAHLVKKGMPVVYEQHNSFIHKNRFIDQWITRKVVAASQSETLKVFVTVSNPLAKIWIDKDVPREKVVVQHDAVDETWLNHPDSGTKRERFGIDAKRKLVLYTGSIYPNRGTDRILKLAHEFPEAYFVIIGWPKNHADSLRDESKRTSLKNVHIIDRIAHSEVPSWLATSDVLLMLWSKEVPTINYCSPMKVFEYMAARKIIVGDGFPTIHEVLEHEKHALLAAPNSFQDLRTQLAKALDMTYPNKMADAAQKLVQEKYLWSVRARNILDNALYLK